MSSDELIGTVASGVILGYKFKSGRFFLFSQTLKPKPTLMSEPSVSPCFLLSDHPLCWEKLPTAYFCFFGLLRSVDGIF